MTGPRSGSDFDDLANDWRAAYALDQTKAKLRAASGKGPSRAKAQREPVTSIAKVEADRGRKNSRTKGNRGELDVAEVFSKWCGEVVRRTPGSGGWKGAQEFGTTADLICKKKAFPYHIEVKHREGWVLDDLVTGVRKDHDKSIVQWWLQCIASCPKVLGSPGIVFKKDPLLVFRRNRQPWLVMAMTKLFAPNHFTVDGYAVTVELLSEFLGHETVPKGLKNHKATT